MNTAAAPMRRLWYGSTKRHGAELRNETEALDQAVCLVQHHAIHHQSLNVSLMFITGRAVLARRDERPQQICAVTRTRRININYAAAGTAV